MTGAASTGIRGTAAGCGRSYRRDRSLAFRPDATSGPRERERPEFDSGRSVDAVRVAYRRSWRTPCWAELASDRAEMPIDWRVDSACEFAASWFRSALVRLAEPVCSTLISCL